MDIVALFLDASAVFIVLCIYLVVFYITKENEKLNDMVIGALSPIITTVVSAIILNYAKVVFH